MNDDDEDEKAVEGKGGKLGCCLRNRQFQLRKRRILK